MPMNNLLDFGTFDYRALGPEQRGRLERRAQARAHAERSEALRAMAGGLASLLRKAAVAYRAHRLRRRRQFSAARLYALDDRALKDIGVSRSEIPARVLAGRG